VAESDVWPSHQKEYPATPMAGRVCE